MVENGSGQFIYVSTLQGYYPNSTFAIVSLAVAADGTLTLAGSTALPGQFASMTLTR
jgi:hypothetical protein